MKAVILAAGKGTRMRGLSNNTPKPMMPIGNRPILEVTFTRLKDMGIDQVALVIGYQGERLQQLIGDGSRYGVKVAYIWQREQLGTGHAAMLCREFIGNDPFVLIFGDILTRPDNYCEIAKLFQSGSCDAVLSVFPVDDPSSGGAVDVRDGRVVNLVEKPKPGSMLNAYINAGLFLWPADIFEWICSLKPSPRGEYEFTDAILSFIKSGRRLAAFELLGYWENITDPESCIRMNQNLLMEILPPTHPEVYDSANIDSSSKLNGTHVAQNAVIGKGCRLDGCIVGEGARIGNGVVAEYAEIGPKAIIGNRCQLGPTVSIGAEASLEDDCRIGPNVSVGPNSSVGEGTTISSSVLLARTKIGGGSSLLHTMLDVNVSLPAGSKLRGTGERAVEVLSGQSPE